MHIIKLDATASTNAFLKDLWQEEKPEDETVVWTRQQYGGRGQQGAEWRSEAGKNLTFSILKYFKGLEVQQQFVLNIAVSLAIQQALKDLKIPDVSIKWPNDIMSGSRKICGILIENIVKAKEIRVSVIGIGLNVNQEDFGMLERASSLRLITGMSYDLDNLIILIIKHLQSKLRTVTSDTFPTLRTSYEEMLYRIELPSTFVLPDGTKFIGVIRGITNTGRLKVGTENGILEFSVKEIRLLN